MAIIKIEINDRTLELSNVPSEFGNLSYYGLLRSVVRKMNELIDYENYDRTYIETFVDEVNKKITLLQEDYNSFKKTTDENYATFTTNINTSFQTFKQNMLESQDTFENDLLNKQTEFEKKITDDITLFTENLTTQFNEYKTSINNSFDSLSDEFKELKTYVTNYLESEEFRLQIGVEVTSYLNTPEFQNLMNQIISEQITSNNVVKKTDVASTTNLGLVKIGDNITIDENGILNVPFAGEQNKWGVVKIGSIDSTPFTPILLDSNNNLNIANATKNKIGAIQLGNTLYTPYDNKFIIEVDPQSVVVKENYQITQGLNFKDNVYDLIQSNGENIISKDSENIQFGSENAYDRLFSFITDKKIECYYTNGSGDRIYNNIVHENDNTIKSYRVLVGDFSATSTTEQSITTNLGGEIIGSGILPSGTNLSQIEIINISSYLYDQNGGGGLNSSLSCQGNYINSTSGYGNVKGNLSFEISQNRNVINLVSKIKIDSTNLEGNKKFKVYIDIRLNADLV